MLFASKYISTDLRALSIEYTCQVFICALFFKFLLNFLSYFSWQPVIDFIDSKYDEYLNAESRVNRTIMPDTRVHCCLYFIAPTGHG